MPDCPDRSAAGETLRKIAAALGCPVETFTAAAQTDAGAGGDASAREIAELLSVWSLIGNPDTRRELLVEIRRVAALPSGTTIPSS